MSVYVWPQRMEPEFPLAVLEYSVAGDRDPMHWHEYLEIALVLEGRGVFLFGRRALEAEVGDVFFIDDSQPHVALAAAGGSMRLLLVLFRPELVAPAGCRSFDAGYLAPFRGAGGRDSPRISVADPLAPVLGAALRDLQSAWTGDADDRYLADAGLRRILALVNHERGDADEGPAGRAAADRRDRIRPVLAYVDRHRSESITLEDVAEVVHASTSRVRHVFKDVTGVSFKEYVTHVRVAEAKRLLLTTDLPVADVAAAVSYSNLHQFYAVFRRMSGMSPGAYRRYYASTPEPAPAAIEAVEAARDMEDHPAARSRPGVAPS